LHLDTRNGRAGFVKQLKVERNQTYALILKPNGQEIIRLVNPKKLEEIIRLLKETLPKKVKREKTGDLGLNVIDELPEMIGWVKGYFFASS